MIDAPRAGWDRGGQYFVVVRGGAAGVEGKLGQPVTKSQIRLPNGPLKIVGEHSVSVAPHGDVVVDVTVLVVAQND